MEVPRDIVYAEVFELLKNIDKEKVMKIPKYILTEINAERNRNIKIEYNWENLLNKEKFYPDTINILGYLNYTYWAETEEEKEKLKKIYNIPEKVTVNEDVFKSDSPKETDMVVSEGEINPIIKESFIDKVKRLLKKYF